LKRYLLATAILCAGATSSCKEKTSIAPDLGFLQGRPETVEIFIPYEEFVEDVAIFGGYGSTADFIGGVIALDFGGLNARTLITLSDFPTSLEVQGSDGITRTDSDLSFVGGRVVLSFDTVNGSLALPVDVELFDIKETWHGPTVTWEVAVDTAGDRRPWTQPGGGPRTFLGGATFDAFVDQAVDPSASRVDRVNVPIDSAAAVGLTDPSSGTVGLSLAAAEPGVLLNLVDLSIVLLTVPSTRPDTVVEVTVTSDEIDFILDPPPSASAGWLRIGGAPAWRSVMRLAIPRTIESTAEVCGTVGCQVDFTAVDLNLAELLLTTRQTESAYQPQDTTLVDLRPVINPESLPKAPLGGPVSVPQILPPELFAAQAGTVVAIPVTSFVIGIQAAAAATGSMPDAWLALLSSPEPNQIGFASFEGLGGPGAPVLRLLYTIADAVALP
jgi:hypothetical protein